MDLEKGILYAATVSKEIMENLTLFGIKEEDFDTPESKRSFRFISEHLEEHGTLPDASAVMDVCRIEIDDQGVDHGYLTQEIMKRKLFRNVTKAMDGFGGRLRSNDPVGALESIKTFAESEAATFSRVRPPTKIFSLGDGVDEAYQKVKSGYMGLPLPWERLNSLTMGLWPATATYFVARPGVGKTHVAMLTAQKCWQEGYRVLIVSPEMSKVEIAERFFILQSGVSANNVMRGTLSDFEYKKLKDCIHENKAADGLFLIDSDDDLSLGGIEAAMRICKPDLVAVDSIYMLHVKGDKTERTMKAVDWIRSASKKFKVPFVCFHQLSRQATKAKKMGGGYDENAIALSDQLLWDAHAVFVMEQDTDMKADKRLRFHVGKLRRGSWDGKPIDCHWDFDSMRFDEIVDDGPKQSFEDDGYEVPF